MEMFRKIIEEYDKYKIGKIIGKEMDLNDVKKACKEYNSSVDESFRINIDINDEEFLKELKNRFSEYIKCSENKE